LKILFEFTVHGTSRDFKGLQGTSRDLKGLQGTLKDFKELYLTSREYKPCIWELIGPFWASA
jgi:hypothetical protein